MRNQLKIGAALVATIAVLGFGTFALASDKPDASVGGPPSSAPETAKPTVQTSDYQATILADGVVTDDEMREAVQATVACLREQGVNAEFLPQTQLWAPPSFRIVSGNPPEHTAEQTRPCQQEYMSELGLPYYREQERKHARFDGEEVGRRMEDCIASKGFPLQGRFPNSYHPARQQELSATTGGARAWRECQMEVQRERWPEMPAP